MQGDSEILELLNEVLTAELTAVNQYFADAKMCENWGYTRLAAHFKDDSIDEMKDAEMLIDRILYLEGVPNLQRLGSVRVGETVPEKLRLGLDVEREAITRLNHAVEVAVAKGDNGTRQLFEQILAGEEEHADWLETQLALVEALGEPLYLAQQVDPSAGPGD
ncbi:MAG TPA: bacterioferritin [Acidimicrobiales bacterium]|jgi:bacterioferritin|nr:bacterioferritin [Acidimicrobiales bacterium]